VGKEGQLKLWAAKTLQGNVPMCIKWIMTVMMDKAVYTIVQNFLDNLALLTVIWIMMVGMPSNAAAWVVMTPTRILPR
jgi:hypothetical protein